MVMHVNDATPGEGAPRSHAGTGPSVSVVICAFSDERWEALRAAVASVQAQTRPAHQLIVAVDHNAGLLERARATWADDAVVLVENVEARGLSGARNAGIAAADGDLVAFLDDDAAADPEWLERLVPVFDDAAVVSAGGSLSPNWVQPRPGWFPREFDWVIGCSYTGMPTVTADVRNAIGANMAFRRAELESVDGFHSGIGRDRGLPMGCEETEVSIRLRQTLPGARIVYEPAAHVRHLVTPGRGTWRYFFERCWAEGRSKALLTGLVGRQDGLSSERTYATRTLPLGVLHGLRDAAARGRLGARPRGRDRERPAGDRGRISARDARLTTSSSEAGALRVLMVTPRYLPEIGGVERHVHEVATRLADGGVHVRVLTTDREGTLPAHDRDLAVDVRRVRARPAGRDWRFAPGLPAAMREGDWDVVHVQSYHTAVAPLAMRSARRHRACRTS